MSEIYKHNYSSEHSIFLKKHFDISSIGVDYYTSNNLAVEFKETFSDNPNANFKISKNQLEISDLVVFCFKTNEFFVHSAKYLSRKYSINNKLNLAVIRHNSIKKNYLFKTNNYQSLKEYLYNFQ